MFVSALLAGAAFAQTDASVVRLEAQSNGSRLFVQRMPNTSLCSVQLVLSADGMAETPSTHGYRHFLEHLMAVGPTADIDRRLESKGLMLQASTTRDATTFRVDCPLEQLEFTVRTIGEVLQPLTVSEAVVTREAQVIVHELALRSNSGRASAAVWASSVGAASLDPAGDPKVIKGATLAGLSSLQQRMTNAKRVLLVICGPVELDKALLAGRNLLTTLRAKDDQAVQPAESSNAYAPEFTGSAVGVKVTGLPATETLAKVGVAMAIAQKLGDPTVTYTPSTRPGMIVMSSTQRGLHDRIKSLQAGYIARGGDNVRRWIQGLIESPSGMASLRGALLIGPTPVNLEQVQSSIGEIGTSELLGALAEWQEAPEVKP